METSRYYESSENSNVVLQNTYKLLSMTLVFSAICAFLGMMLNIPPMGSVGAIIFLVVYFVNLFLIEKNKNNSMGIFFVFTLTGMLGLTLAPMLNHVIAVGNGDTIVTALFGTGASFFIASYYGKSTKSNLNKFAPILMISILVAFVLSLVNFFFFQSSVLSILVSSAFVVLSTFMIAFETQNIINGGERNYVSATVTLYIAIYNIFVSLLNILNRIKS